MDIRKIAITSVLSAALLTIGAADSIVDTQPVAQAHYAEGNITARNATDNITEATYESRVRDICFVGMDMIIMETPYMMQISSGMQMR